MVNLWDEDSGLRVKQPAQEKQSLGSLVGLDKANSAQAAPVNNGIQATGNKQANPYQTGNGYGIRNILTGGGIANGDVDWNSNNGMVTLYGNDFYKPDRVVDGVSYVDDPSKLLQAMGESGNAATNAAVQGYKNIYGKNVVQATDYLANKGTNFQADWNNGNLMVNGNPVNYEFVLNGKAYVDSAELDRAIAQAQKAAGVQNEADILRKYQDRYEDMLADRLDSINNRKEFSYDPLSDPAYLAYRDMYNREGDRAMRDAMGAAQAASGGYMNSAAAIAAAQQNNYYTQQLNDKVPELMQFAYQRYADDFTRNRQALQDIRDTYKFELGNEYNVNQDIINRINYNNQLDDARDDKAYERNWNEKLYSDQQERYEREWNRDESRYQDDLYFRNQDNDRANKQEYRADRQFDMSEEAYNIDKVIQAGQSLGGFTPEQNAILAKAYGAPEGTVFDPFGLEKNTAAVNYSLSKKYGGASGGSKSGSGSRSGKSSGSTGNKYEADKLISQWIYSPEGIGGGYLYDDWGENTDPVYAARDKLNNPDVRDAIYYYLLDNGYTEAQAASKLKEYDKNIAAQLKQYEEQGI